MKHLSTLMAMFLLVGCQTTQSAEVDTKPPPEKPKLELKDGRYVLVNDDNVLCIEVFSEE